MTTLDIARDGARQVVVVGPRRGAQDGQPIEVGDIGDRRPFHNAAAEIEAMQAATEGVRAAVTHISHDCVVGCRDSSK